MGELSRLRAVVEELPTPRRVLVETLAFLLGFTVGTVTMEFVVTDGKLVRAHFHRGPVKGDEIETVKL